MTDNHHGNIHIFPGVKRPDLEADLPVQLVLREAGADGLVDVVVVGRVADGSIRMRATGGDIDKVLALLIRAANYLASHPSAAPIQPDEDPA